jgi:hypothetical protein
VAVLLGMFAMLPSHAGSTPEDLAGARERQEEARVALDAANESLFGVRGELDKLDEKLADAYRVLDNEMRRRDRAKEAESRAKVETLKSTRDQLWTKRDRAETLVAQREAELDSAQALVRIHELQSAANADSSQVKKWQKRHEKALAKARRLERSLEEPGRPEG